MSSERLRHVRVILLQGAVAIIPLTFSTAFLDPFNVPKLGLLVLVVGLSIGLLAAEMIVTRGSGPPSAARALIVPVVALTLPLAIAWVAGPYREWSFLGEYRRFQGVVPYAVVAAFGLLVAESFRSAPVRLVWAMSIAGGAVGGYLFLQLLGLDPVAWPETSEPYTASTIGNENFAGGFLAVALAFSIYLWVHADRWHLVGAGLTIFTAFGLIFTFSQGPWAAGVAASVIVIGYAAAVRWPRVKPATLIIVAAIAIAVPIAVGLARVGVDLGRLGPTAEVRAHLWGAAIDVWGESPIVGRGPNSFALDGLRYVPIENTLLEPATSPDDPHSVFFSFLANAGLLGAAGYLVALGWFVREAIRLAPRNHLGVAFLASGSAYWVQSLASIDELVLRVGLWVSLAGLVACRTVGDRAPLSVSKRPKSTSARGAIAIVSVSVVAGSIAWVSTFVRADLHARRGATLHADGRMAAGQAEFDRALQLRDDVEYRLVLARGLGSEAVARGAEGGDLIAGIDAVNSYLDDLPFARGIFTEAQILHHWGHFEPGADARAFDLYERGLRLDPSNLLALIESAEVLVDLGRPDEAIARLQPLATRLEGRVPPFWGGLAIALAVRGDEGAARASLARGGAAIEADCRALIATELIRQGSSPGPPPDDAAFRLRFSCGPGLYGFMLDHLPAEVRAFY